MRANRGTLPTIKDVSRKMSTSMTKRFSIIFGSICFLALGVVVVGSAVQTSNAIFESSLPHLSALLAVQDSYEYSRQLSSVVETNTMSGYWLYDKSQLLVWSLNSEQPSSFDGSVSIQFLNRALSIVTKHKFTDGDKHDYTLLFSSTVSLTPFVLFIALSVVIIAYFARFFRRKFDTLAETLSKPIALFESHVASAKSEKSTQEFPASELRYLEIFSLDNEFKALQAGLKDRDVRLQESAKANAIAQTTAMIAHDLKAPLTVVEQAVSVKDWSNYISLKPNLQSALYRMQTMIDALKKTDIDELVRQEKSEIDVNHLVSELIPLAERSGVTVTINAHTIFAMVDKLKVERAIQNLVVNAIETNASHVWVNVRTQGADFIFEAIDNGPGIHPSISNKLFERGSTYGKVGGSGLGLKWVMAVAKGHGGVAEYIRENKLTIFRILIPNCVINQELSIIKSDPVVMAINSDKTTRVLIAIKNQDQRSRFSDVQLESCQIVIDGQPELSTFENYAAVCTDDLEFFDFAMDKGMIAHFFYESENPKTILKMISKKISAGNSK